MIVTTIKSRFIEWRLVDNYYVMTYYPYDKCIFEANIFFKRKANIESFAAKSFDITVYTCSYLCCMTITAFIKTYMHV